MRPVLAALVLAAGVTYAGPSLAATTVPGGALATQSWTLAGSPYTVTGDVTIPVGETLTIEPGVVVVFTATDGLAAGIDTARVELTIQGTLVAAGTPSARITMSGATASPGAWYGVVVAGTASGSILENLDVVSPVNGLSLSATGVNTYSNVTVRSASVAGASVSGGSPTLTGFAALGGSNRGIDVGEGSATFTGCLLRGNAAAGVLFHPGATSRALTLDHCTIVSNAGNGIQATNSYSNSTLSVVSSIVASNGSYGIMAINYSSSVTFSDVWGNAVRDYFDASSAGVGTVSANPLFAAPPDDLRLTSNSPARGQGVGGTDMGAFPYAGTPTSTLMGTLRTDWTLTLAGSPYTVTGDLTVPAGVTLTIEPGVVVRFSATDGMGGGVDPTRAELSVLGTLLAIGTAQAPILFEGATATPWSWTGIRVEAGAAVPILAYLVIKDPVIGLSLASAETFSIPDVSVFRASNAGVVVATGNVTLDRLSVIGADGAFGDGLRVTNGSATVTHCILRNNGGDGVNFAPTSAQTLVLEHCTIAFNGGDGVRGGGAGSVTEVRSSIIARNGRMGVVGGIVTNTLAWGNLTFGDFFGGSIGVGCISANPLFVAPPADLALTSNSPARNGAADGTDMGAFPYTGTPTSTLMGTLWTDRTLTLAGSPYTVTGDLTVPPGGTVTIEPGVVVRYSATDGMGAGDDPGKVELRVDGTLVADGTQEGPITFDGATALPGSWTGVRIEAGATGCILDHVTILNPVDGLSIRSGGSNTYSAVSIAGASGVGAFIGAGVQTIDRLSIADGADDGLFVGHDASATLTNCVLRGNARAGSTSEGALELDHCTIARNGGAGVQVWGTGSSSLSLNDSIVASNGGIGISVTGGVGAVTYADVWGNSLADFSGASAGVGTISVDPLFVSAADLRLSAGSPCIDAGTGTGGIDAAGVARPVDGDWDGVALSDMGAYEFVPLVVCGDGVAEGLEACDDGNAVDTDSCTNACIPAACGDGVVQVGVEECDDGNSVDTDGCRNTCLAARCDDGVVEIGVEECDDGNSDDTDACPSTCVRASCGDGFVHSGLEECDDGNKRWSDGCTGYCKLERPPDAAGCSCGAGLASGPEALIALLAFVVRRRPLRSVRGRVGSQPPAR